MLFSWSRVKHDQSSWGYLTLNLTSVLLSLGGVLLSGLGREQLC